MKPIESGSAHKSNFKIGISHIKCNNIDLKIRIFLITFNQFKNNKLLMLE